MEPKLRKDEEVLVDAIAWLDATGGLVRQVDLLEAWQAHRHFKGIWNSKPRKSPDIFHTNSVQIVPADIAGTNIKAGQILSSMRHLNSIQVVDPDSGEVVWHLEDVFRAQHDPRLLDDGSMLMFDNKGLGSERSRALAYDLATKEVTWWFEGSESEPFFTPDCGHAQRLPNGNTLLNESARGRAIEVDPEDRIVWEYRTDQQTEEGDVARFFEFRRLPVDFDVGALTGKK
jgi:hypothetical protein